MVDRGASASREEECKQLLATYGTDRFELLNEAIESQFRTLQNRAQVLLAICGVLLTASMMLMTGKVIARPTLPHLTMAGGVMTAGGAMDILSAAIAVSGVLRIRWSSVPGSELRAWVMSRLVHRDRKTRALHASITLLLVSMILYQTAATMVLVRL